MNTKRKKSYTYPPPLQVRVKPELRQAIKELASNERRSLNSYLTVLLEEHVRKVSSIPAEARAA